MNKVFSIFTALLFFAATGFSQSADVLDRGIGRFREGYLEWDAAKMESGLTLLEQAPADRLSRYWQNVARFNLQLCRNETESPETIRILEETIRENPQDAESAIMLAVLYGRQIAAKPVRALWLGRKIKALRAAALHRGAENPRVQSLAGACWMQAPDPFGDRALALEHLQKAAVLYDAELARTPGFRQPHWGAAECFGMLGDLMVLNGDPAKARLYYQDALRHNPLYSPAKEGLMRLENENKN